MNIARLILLSLCSYVSFLTLVFIAEESVGKYGCSIPQYLALPEDTRKAIAEKIMTQDLTAFDKAVFYLLVPCSIPFIVLTYLFECLAKFARRGRR